MRANILFITLVFLIIFFFGNCATPIKNIYKKQDKYQGKNVFVKGRVISSLELIDLYSFTVRDRTGNIMVVTENLLPLKNDKIKVRGKLEKNFNYKEQNMVVIKERKFKLQKLEKSKKKIEKI